MTQEKRQRILDHLEHLRSFQDAAVKMSMKLFDQGYDNLARLLLANSQIHDRSKLFGVEWSSMVLGERPDLLKTAVEQHCHSNEHHPEYFGGIHNMDDVHVAEMVCDFKARSEKFGTDLRAWINDEAMSRYGFTKNDPVYEKIMRFVDLICDKPFARLQ